MTISSKGKVNQHTIKKHIYYLADDALIGRETGTTELKKAATYLSDQFKSYGLQPNPETRNYYQEVNLMQSAPPESTSVEINGKSISDFVVLSGAPVASREAVFLGFGLESDYKDVDVTDKLVITKAGNQDANDTRSAYGLKEAKRKLAEQNGAAGLIELLNAKEQMWSFLLDNFNRKSISSKDPEASTPEDFAYVWVFDQNAELASEIETSSLKSASLQMSGASVRDVTSYNIVGIVEGSDPDLKDEYIIYSAHYDHVGIGTPDVTGDSIYNGARDNAVGTTTVLSMAENLAKYPTKRSALFILFTAEEKGLLGSRYYVENPILPLHQMVYCFNSDNGGYNDTSLATIVGLSRTTAEKTHCQSGKFFWP